MEEEFTEYLVSASEKLLLEYGQTADLNDAKKQQDLIMVRLHAQYLNDIQNMQYCVSLKICDLSGNFITNIDALECCTNLIKLDLHNNQLEELPGPIFWGSMADLSLLYLHDNGISTLENVHSLSFCPNLIALTLFNTPLCLKIAYRHIVVNSIFSLKALDYYVISDEEIMEDWRLPEKYKPFTLSFFVDFPPLSGKETTFREEMKMIRGIISKINYVLAHHSPVLIIQKWIRGYLIRKILCLIPVHHILRYKRYIKDRTKYIQPRSSVYSIKSCISHTIKPEQHAEEKKLTSGIQTTDVKDLKELHLYLRKLNYPILSTILRLEEKKRIKEKKARRSPRKDLLEWKKTEMKEDGMATKFRLSVHRMPFYSLTEELQRYQDRDKDFFDAVQDLRYVMHPIPQTMPVHEPGSIDKRIFAKAFGTIRLRPLYAIDKAYWESQKLDAHLKKEREVMRMQIAKSEADDYVNKLHEGKIEKLQKNYEKEKLMFCDILEECKHKRSKLISKMRQKYTRFLDRKEEKVLENTFIQRFSSQHTSLTRGLLRLDGWRNCKEGINEKKHIIKGTVEEQKQRKGLYKHFHEERLQMVQKQNTNEKCFRKFVTREMSKGRLQQSKAKVEAVKKPRVKILYTLPVIGSSGTAVPVAEYDG
ncbi:leucine-rich repeat and IQ domain-containing protein 3 [Elgaria multicarinata webbii]|uniref:leucine-rich repeat and IQ domain-containing protein 3 n=1 Tax=Elgaria multicarinata webbii TaxID=159646 RepID=UPI002FCD19D4